MHSWLGGISIALLKTDRPLVPQSHASFSRSSLTLSKRHCGSLYLGMCLLMVHVVSKKRLNGFVDPSLCQPHSWDQTPIYTQRVCSNEMSGSPLFACRFAVLVTSPLELASQKRRHWFDSLAWHQCLRASGGIYFEVAILTVRSQGRFCHIHKQSQYFDGL